MLKKFYVAPCPLWYNPGYMEDILNRLPLTFIPLFVAIDAFWVMALISPYVADKPTRAVFIMATKSVLTALGISLGFLALGEAFFSILGITVNDFKGAGGLLLLVISIVDLLSPGRSLLGDGDDAGVFPLGTPLIAGPALLTTLLVLMDHYGALPTLAALVLNLILLWACMASVRLVVRVIPRSLLVALSKIMSVILASIAVMMIRLGLMGILEGMFG
jgi:multiple antibiotic resistance protein